MLTNLLLKRSQRRLRPKMVQKINLKEKL